MKRIVLFGCVLAAACLGTLRFGGRLHPAPVWADVGFIVSAAGAVALTVSIILAQMRRAARVELLADDRPLPPRHDEPRNPSPR